MSCQKQLLEAKIGSSTPGLNGFLHLFGGFVMPKRQLNAKEIVRDIRSGMDDAALMEKHALSPKGLQSVYDQLVRGGHVAEADVHKAPESLAGKPCPACNTVVPTDSKFCPYCGIVIAKHNAWKESARRGKAADAEKAVPKDYGYYSPEVLNFKPPPNPGGRMVSCPKCGDLTARAGFPTWAIVVAICFFPLGLLALLAGREPTVCPNCKYTWLP
jgi:hypothetical protein